MARECVAMCHFCRLLQLHRTWRATTRRSGGPVGTGTLLSTTPRSLEAGFHLDGLGGASCPTPLENLLLPFTYIDILKKLYTVCIAVGESAGLQLADLCVQQFI